MPKRRAISNAAHVLLLVAAALAGVFDQATYGWGAPIAASALPSFFLIFYWRDCWRRVSFWVAVAAAIAIQAPLVIFARPKIEQYRPNMIIFMLIDGLIAAVIVSLVSQLDPRSPLASRNYSNPPR